MGPRDFDPVRLGDIGAAIELDRRGRRAARTVAGVARVDDRLRAVLDAKRAALDDKSGIGIIACIEERIAARDIALLGADRQHAQYRHPQQA